MTMRRRLVRQGLISIGLALLASCVAPPPKAPTPPAPLPAPPRPAPSLPAAQPGVDWRDVPLTPGRWTWHGGAGRTSLSQYGLPGGPAVFALRCDTGTRAIILSMAQTLAGAGNAMTLTTSFGAFTLAAAAGGGAPPAIVAQLAARDPRLDQLAFSRGRFLVDAPGQARLVLPAWPEVARVIEDCRS